MLLLLAAMLGTFIVTILTCWVIIDWYHRRVLQPGFESLHAGMYRDVTRVINTALKCHYEQDLLPALSVAAHQRPPVDSAPPLVLTQEPPRVLNGRIAMDKQESETVWNQLDRMC